jgi:hypothetical protein
MRLMTISQILKFGESQTHTHRQKRLPSRRVAMEWVHLNRQAVRCPIKSARIFDEAISILGACYE